MAEEGAIGVVRRLGDTRGVRLGVSRSATEGYNRCATGTTNGYTRCIVGTTNKYTTPIHCRALIA